MRLPVLLIVSGLAAGALLAGKPEVEPEYHSEKPLYGKIAFDLEGKTVVWAVLDSTGKRKGNYDVLYFDRNADGDLTGEGEKIGLKDRKFSIGTFVDANSKAEHTELCISVDPKELDVMFRMSWKGKESIKGGYSPVSGPYLRYVEDPEKAPTIQPVAEGPFQVQTWMLGSLKIGKSSDVKFFLGHPGKGTHAFCAVHQEFLEKGDGLKATLIYKTKAGEERRTTHKLLDRC